MNNSETRIDINLFEIVVERVSLQVDQFQVIDWRVHVFDNKLFVVNSEIIILQKACQAEIRAR